MSETKKTRVLFVDDEAMILSGLRRQCRRTRPDWITGFAESGADAIKKLTSDPYDVVVSDMRMPGMSGAELLDAVRCKWPDTHRIILSGQTDQTSLLEHIGSIHRYLQKPCEFDQIITSIEQSLRVRDEVSSSRLASIASRIEALPVMTTVHKELMSSLNNENASIDDIADIVAKDPGLSVKILQLVNSAFFCLPSKINSLTAAVHRIGLNNLHSIAMTAKLFDALEKGDTRNSSLSGLWNQCAEVGSLAESLATDNHQPQSVSSQAKLAGMLSLIGRAIMIVAEPDSMEDTVKLAESSDIPLSEAEHKVFGVYQHTLGAYALGIWAFDDVLSESILWQTAPEGTPPMSLGHPAVYLHAARAIAACGNGSDRVTPNLDLLADIGFDLSRLDSSRRAA